MHLIGAIINDLSNPESVGDIEKLWNEWKSKINISFKNSAGQYEFLDYNDLFMKIMEYIKSEFDQLRVQTKLVIIPSAREI